MSTLEGTSVLFGPITKRAFKKSRSGCRTCKQRKVKCDESRPLCGNCARRFVGLSRCEFDFDPFMDVGGSIVQKLQAVPKSVPLPLANPPLGIRSSERRRLLELRLMHHYSIFTCKQLPGWHTAAGKHIWAVDIPRRALNSEIVLSPLLGLAAQHLWGLNPSDQSLAVASRYYFDRAVSSHRASLEQADNTTAESMLAAAILITHHTWLAAHSTPGTEPYALPLQTYYMARGVQSLFSQMFPWLKTSGYLWYAEEQPVADVTDPGEYSEFLDVGMSDLNKLSGYIDNHGVSTEDKLVYEMSIMELASIYRAIKTEAPQDWLQRRVATMPIRLSSRFLELLEMHDPAALVILARNIALLNFIDRVWWLHGVGNHQVTEYAIEGIRGLIPEKWLWAMEWPLKVAGLTAGYS